MPSPGASFRAARVRYRGHARHALFDRDGRPAGLLIASAPGETAAAFGRELGQTHEATAVTNRAELAELATLVYFALEILTPTAWAEVERLDAATGDVTLAAKLVAEGRAAAARGDRAAAHVAFDHAIEADPSRAPAHYWAADLLETEGRLPDALARYDAAVRLAPELADAWSDRAHVLGRLQRNEDALASCVRAIAVEPSHMHAWLNKAGFEAALGRIDAACDSLDTFLVHADADPAEGAKLTQRALALSEQLVALRTARTFAEARALDAAGRKAEAIAGYDRVLALDPHAVEALHNKGTCLEELGRHAEALACYDAALRVSPGAAITVAQRAKCAARLARPSAPASGESVCPSCGEKNRAGAPFCTMCKTVLNRSKAKN